MGKRKRCPFCKELFWPDRRVAKRQASCRKDSCQGQRRKQTQKRWRTKHPEDATARRFRAQVARAKAGQRPSLPRAPPSGIEHFPWEEVRDETSSQLYIIIVFFAHFVVRLRRDERLAQVPEMIEQLAQLSAAGAKDEKVRATPPG